MTRRRLPIGIQTFRTLRERDCYYVDKTAFIERLLDEGTHYFLSRPRRFGKSLFLDTLKELFEGLHIHSGRDWSERHPVVRLSFGGSNFTEPAHLLRRLVQDAGRQTANSIRLARLLEAHDCTGLKELFQASFASIPYQRYTNNHIADYEGFYASVVYSYFAALGYEIAVEESSSHRRLDMAVHTGGHVFLFEFKVVELSSPGSALAQCRSGTTRRSTGGGGSRSRWVATGSARRQPVQPRDAQRDGVRGGRRLMPGSPVRPHGAHDVCCVAGVDGSCQNDSMAESIVSAVAAPVAHRDPESLEFPGCRPVRITRDEIADREDRFEYWDADTEVAMVCEPVGYYHERPAHRLAQLADRIAAVRGAPIGAVGHTDLLVRNARGERQRIMQADQILFLQPAQTIPRGNEIEVGMDALPDVVLEVDNTTDVRRGKLGLYESWGFREVWVEVPDEPAPSRPAALRPGLTIYALERGRLRPAPASRAFPGWTAEEIHLALNEPELSEETAGVLNRVGRTLGAAQGTGPDSDPFLRRQRTESRAEGRAEAQRASALQVLKSRGVAVSASLAVRLAGMEGVSEHLVAAALACRDQEHFVQLLSARRDGQAPHPGP